MGDSKFRAKINTLSYDYMRDGSFNPASCLRMAQSIGEIWGYDKGFYVRDLMKNGRVLMQADSVCEFGERNLKYEGYVFGEYWSNGPRGRLIQCCYRFTDSKGTPVFNMVNYYIVVDLKERKALYPEDLGVDISNYSEDECPVKNDSFIIDEDIPLAEYEKRIIRRNETDMLGHVNNTCYPNFATDTFRGENFERGFSRMVVRFLSELKKGDEMTIMKGENDKKIIVSGINGSGKTSFQTLFEKRPV